MTIAISLRRGALGRAVPLGLATLLGLGLASSLACSSGGGGGGGGGSSPGGDAVPTTNAEHNKMLDDLGFTTELGPREDPDGEDVASSYHPLRKRFSAFPRKAELFVAGLNLDATSAHLFDDGPGFSRIALPAALNLAWTSATYKDAVAADVDGDGMEEIFVAYYEAPQLRYILIDVDASRAPGGVIDANVPVPATTEPLVAEWTQPSLAAGDLDGDGRYEVAVGFGRTYLVDALETTNPTVQARTFAGQDSKASYVAMGNVDWDGPDELVVTYTKTGDAVLGQYAIYDGSFNEPPTAGGTLAFDIATDIRKLAESRVAIGDVDGDRVGEIVFAGRVGTSNAGMFVLEFLGTGLSAPYAVKPGVYIQPPSCLSTTGGAPRPFFTLDVDGPTGGAAHPAEVLICSAVYRLQTDPPGFAYAYFQTPGSRAVAADVDADGRDDVILRMGGETAVVRVYGLDSLGNFSLKKQWSGTATDGWGDSIVMASANVDRDSPMLRYDGQHELLFTAPQVVAVLASPPYHAGIGQNVAATSSTFGTSVGNTAEEETSLAFRTGFSIGYETPNTFIASGGFKATIEASVDRVASESMTIEKYHSFTTGPGEDKVVFTTIPFDVFYYQVVSSPDAEDVGRTVAINVPREPQTLAASRAFYNAHNGGGLDVDSRILVHTPGNVWSYPTLAARDTTLAAAAASVAGYRPLWNGPSAISEGTGFDLLGISVSEGSRESTAMNVGVDFEFHAGAGGVQVGRSVGFTYGYKTTLSTTESAYFEGRVGNIPAASFTPANQYKYGIFVYPGSLEGQKFLVMNYWTEH